MDFPLKGDISMVYFSVEHPKCPEYKEKNIVRAETRISGYIIR
jgi:hypothetical protein